MLRLKGIVFIVFFGIFCSLDALGLILPKSINYQGERVAALFNSELNQHFTFKVDGYKCDEVKGEWRLAMLLYRGDVDNRFVGLYRPPDGKPEWCSISFDSKKNNYAYKGDGWNGPSWKPGIKGQIYCSRSGLLNPELCVVDPR